MPYDQPLFDDVSWDIVYPVPKMLVVHFGHIHKQVNDEIQRFSFQNLMESGDEINDRVQGNVYFHSFGFNGGEYGGKKIK